MCLSSCPRRLFHLGVLKNQFFHILPFVIQYDTFAQPTLTQKEAEEASSPSPDFPPPPPVAKVHP